MPERNQRTSITKIFASLPVEEKFFGGALCILDGSLGVLAWRTSGNQQTFLVIVFAILFLAIVAFVCWMRVDQNRRLHAEKIAESVTGSAKFAECLADDICEAFDG